jgi:hypothetical protein
MGQLKVVITLLEGNGEAEVKADIALGQLCASLRSQGTDAEASVQDVEAHRLKCWLHTVEQLIAIRRRF